MWKFADDTTISEVVTPSKESLLQKAVDYINNWSQENRLQLKPSKCKEIQSCFKRSPPSFTPVEIDGVFFKRVSTVKLLGVTIREDFKWTDHIRSISVKAA